jgi:hypothetical protein
MKRNVKHWMIKAAITLALGAGMLSFATQQASAQSRNQRFEDEQPRERQERDQYRNRAVNPRNQQEQRRFTYQQPYREYGHGQYGYGQYGYGQYGHYGTPQPYYQNQYRGWDDDDDRYYQNQNRGWDDDDDRYYQRNRR